MLAKNIYKNNCDCVKSVGKEEKKQQQKKKEKEQYPKDF